MTEIDMLILHIDPSLHCLIVSKLGYDNSLYVCNCTCICHSLYIFFMSVYSGPMALVLNKVLYCIVLFTFTENSGQYGGRKRSL